MKPSTAPHLFRPTAIALGALALFATGTAAAVPQLQLNVVDGVYHDANFGPAGYESGKETIAAGTPEFTLQALATPSGNLTDAEILARTFYISIALVPGPSLFLDQGNNIAMGTNPSGSFDISFADENGAHPLTTINVSEDMIWGTPPLDATYDDLQTHGIFETYYTEVAFDFVAANKAIAFDVETDGGQEAAVSALGTMFFQNFLIDTTNLDPLYEIHFDLYAYECTINGPNEKCSIDINAPFSHDAMSWPPDFEVSEPGTLGLLCLAFGGLWLRRRRHNQ